MLKYKQGLCLKCIGTNKCILNNYKPKTGSDQIP